MTLLAFDSIQSKLLSVEFAYRTKLCVSYAKFFSTYIENTGSLKNKTCIQLLTVIVRIGTVQVTCTQFFVRDTNVFCYATTNSPWAVRTVLSKPV